MFLGLESYEWNEYFEIVLTIAKYGFLIGFSIIIGIILWNFTKEDAKENE